MITNLEPLCKYNQIPIRFTKDINSQESYNWIKSLSPDVIFCLGWSSLLKKIFYPWLPWVF